MLSVCQFLLQWRCNENRKTNSYLLLLIKCVLMVKLIKNRWKCGGTCMAASVMCSSLVWDDQVVWSLFVFGASHPLVVSAFNSMTVFPAATPSNRHQRRVQPVQSLHEDAGAVLIQETCAATSRIYSSQ